MSIKYLGVILAVFLYFSPPELLAQRYPKSEKNANLEAKASLSEIHQKNSSIWLAGDRLSKKELADLEGFDVNLYSKGRTKAGILLEAVGIALYL